ncbi:hypothetical protein YTPLAS18_05210 [Nitrospira sp.]|nr:hypothetical protein YTPLAS18_05210 [Nitrospira sp.]
MREASLRRRLGFALLMSLMLLAPLASLDSAAHESAKLGKLGTVHFPTSARSRDAQAHFLRGVAALHSFWYPVALEEFRAATEMEPDFAMAYWGQAMTYNHPLWGDPQETDAARNALSHVTNSAGMTPREHAYLAAAKILYGQGEKRDRDRAYAAAMEEIYRTHPDDLEAAAFYALALLGAVQPHDPTALRTRMKAGALVQEVYRREPDHPGGAHYMLHAFDDPDHAVLALRAAEQYAEIAPGAPHALHMPSHIFLQLGLWSESASSNAASWAASEQWVRDRGLRIDQRDYHSLHWLFYSYIQQARYEEAKRLLQIMQESLPQFSTDDPYNVLYGLYVEAQMAAGYLTATRQWDMRETILSHSRPAVDVPPAASPSKVQSMTTLARTPALFAAGFASAMVGAPEWRVSQEQLRGVRQHIDGMDLPLLAALPEILEVQELEITAVAAAAQQRFDEAIETMTRAIRLVQAMPPPSGPPPVITPPHELFGQILLLANRPEEAAEEFALALRRHPNRAASLLGAARAASRQGDRLAAAKAYATLARQWAQASAQWPDVEEARLYLKEVGTP